MSNDAHAASGSGYSLRRWLSRWLAIQAFLALGVVCLVIYVSANVQLSSRQQALLQQQRAVIEHLASEYARDGNLAAFDHKLNDFFHQRADVALRLTRYGETRVYGEGPQADSGGNVRQARFSLSVFPQLPTRMGAELYLDTAEDARLRAILAWTLVSCALLGALAVSAIGNMLVRRALVPLRHIGQQAAMLSPEKIGERLNEDGLADEIRPLVLQFNAVLQRLESAYLQMEGFNADVAHELRTPLATLTGETEYALAGKRSMEELRETLGSNLEELQRMGAIVNDMLLLSRADRGVRARLDLAGSLRHLVAEVLDYHEAEALDAHVVLKVVGDARARVDRSLFQRAISNLISNAIRYSAEGSEVTVALSEAGVGLLKVTVINRGQPIDAAHLPYLFQRFYRSDPSRSGEAGHHGLGLAIVAAIASMHGGKPFAESYADRTAIGFTLAADPAAAIRNDSRR